MSAPIASIDKTLTQGERLSPFGVAQADTEPLPKMTRLFCFITADGTFEDIDPVTTWTVDVGRLPTSDRKSA